MGETGQYVPSAVELSEPSDEGVVAFVGSALVVVQCPARGSLTIPLSGTGLAVGDRVWVGEFDQLLGPRPMAVAFERDGRRVTLRRTGPTPTQAFHAQSNRARELFDRLTALGVVPPSDRPGQASTGAALGDALLARFGPPVALDPTDGSPAIDRQAALDAIAAATARWVEGFALAPQGDALVVRVDGAQVEQHALVADGAAVLRAAMASADAVLAARGAGARWTPVDSAAPSAWLLAPPELLALASEHGFAEMLLAACRADAARRRDAAARGRSCYVLETYEPPPSDTRQLWVDARLDRIRSQLTELLVASGSPVPAHALWSMIFNDVEIRLWAIARGVLVAGLDARGFVTVHLPGRAGVRLDDASARAAMREQGVDEALEAAARDEQTTTARVELAWEPLAAALPALPAPLLRTRATTPVNVAPGQPSATLAKHAMRFDGAVLRQGYRNSWEEDV